jgi:hypothetical protein
VRCHRCDARLVRSIRRPSRSLQPHDAGGRSRCRLVLSCSRRPNWDGQVLSQSRRPRWTGGCGAGPNFNTLPCVLAPRSVSSSVNCVPLQRAASGSLSPICWGVVVRSTAALTSLQQSTLIVTQAVGSPSPYADLRGHPRHSCAPSDRLLLQSVRWKVLTGVRARRIREPDQFSPPLELSVPGLLDVLTSVHTVSS